MQRLKLDYGPLGRGLFLNEKNNVTTVSEKEILFLEEPVEVVPLFFSEQLCVECLRPLGSVTQRVARILELATPKKKTTLSPSEKEALDVVSGVLNEMYGQQDIKDNMRACVQESEITTCPRCGCCVCSSHCFTALGNTPWHHISCSSLGDTSSREVTVQQKKVLAAWHTFSRYARRHYEGFLLVARLLCRIAMTYELKGEKEALTDKMLHLTYPVESNSLQWAQIHVSRRRLNGLQGSNADSEIDDCEKECVESYRLLAEFFRVRAESIDNSCNAFLLCEGPWNFYYYVQLLVQCELVNVDIVIEDPLRQSLITITTSPPISELHLSQCKKAFHKARNVLYPTRTKEKHDLTGVISLVFQDIMGYSYSPILGFMNHSCSPNVMFHTSWRCDGDTSAVVTWTPSGLCSSQPTHALTVQVSQASRFDRFPFNPTSVC